MPLQWVTPHYLRDFYCLGPDCQDTCCQRWDVHYDKAHYDILMAQIQDRPVLRQKIIPQLKLTPPTANKTANFALISFGETGYCPFLDAEKWCLIHRELGIAALNNSCSFFPRVFSQHQQVVEMTGALSCPEVVRRCLSMQYSNAWVETSPTHLPRCDDIPRARELNELDNYTRGFDDIRQVLLGLISRDDYGFETRLFFLANFSSRLAADYHQGARCDPALIQTEIDRIRDPKTLDALDDFYNHYSGVEPVAMVVIQSILQLHLQQSQGGGIETMITDIFVDYAQRLRATGTAEVFADNIPAVCLWECYQQDWQVLNTHWGVLLEVYLGRYLHNCLQREWFINMPDPFSYVHMLTVRVAVLKFLLTAHRAMRNFVANHPRIETGDPLAEDKEFLHEVVTVVYQFARAIDQNLKFLQVVYAALAEQQMISFDYSLPLIKF
ncbi:MAG: flagellin lysine-N-methylase [Gammaproteobacteria bacterium]|nr:flagellin lysine-N-methylase [Gammaproteobacteria bacterium]